MSGPDPAHEELILRNLSRHIALNPEERQWFAGVLKPVSFSRKQFVLKEGEISHFTSFVCSGCLRSYFLDENGFAHVLQFAVEDWWIGDMHSMLYQKPSQLNIDALEPSAVLQIHQDDLEELYVRIPKLERFFRILTQASMASLQQRIVAGLSKTATERYLDFRRQYPFLEGRLPQHQIASFLGVTPEFLSIIRKKLSQGAAGTAKGTL